MTAAFDSKPIRKPSRGGGTPRLRGAVLACILLGLFGLFGHQHGATKLIAGSLVQGQAPVDLSPHRWRTFAHGDEVLTLVTPPDDREHIWSGSEGGGLLVWNVATGEHDQYLRPQQAGLAGNRVYGISFDGQGFAWLATDGGVSRVPREAVSAGLPGAAWRAWGPAQGLPEVPLRAIAATPDGRVWAGATDSDPGLFVLDPGADVWRAVAPEDEPALDGRAVDGPGAASVVALAADRQGRLWLAHGRGGSERPALSLREVDGRWRHVRAVGPRENPSLGPRTTGIIALWVDTVDGALWASGWARGLSRWDGALWRHFDQEDGLCSDTVTAFAQAPSGVLWVACSDAREGEGTAYLEPGADRWQSLAPEAEIAPWVGAMAFAGDRPWLGTNGPGPGGRGIVSVDGHDSLRSGEAAPAANEITALAHTTSGMTWVGTRGSGLLGYDGRTWRQIGRSSTDGRLAGDVVTDLAIRGDELWLAAAKSLYRDGAWQDGGVSVLDAADGTLRRSYRADGVRLPDGDIGSLAVDRAGVVWIGIGVAAGGPGTRGTTHHGDGLIRHDPNSDSWRLLDSDQSGGGLAGNTVVDIAAGAGGMWAATSFHHDPTSGQRTGGGVSRVDLAGEAWRTWRGGDEGLATFRGSGEPGGREAAVTGDLRAIHVGADGRVLAGSYVAGRPASLPSLWPNVDAVLNIRDDQSWRTITFAGQGWVSALAEDGAGRWWVGTTRGHAPAEEDPAGHTALDRARGGLRIVNGSDVQSVTPAEGGLAGRGVSALAYDASTGAMWVGTENGGLSVYMPTAPAPEPTRSATRPPRVTPRPPGEATPTSAAPTRPPTRTPRPSTPRQGGPLWLPLLQPAFGAGEATPPAPTPDIEPPRL